MHLSLNNVYKTIAASPHNQDAHLILEPLRMSPPSVLFNDRVSLTITSSSSSEGLLKFKIYFDRLFSFILKLKFLKFKIGKD
jgi:hypothetical protein